MPTPKPRTLANGQVRWTVRFRANGSQTSLPFATRAEADKFARDCKERGGQWALDNYLAEQEMVREWTVGEWAEHWLEHLTVSPGTVTNYARDWKVRWGPHLGHIKLSRLGEDDIAAAVLKQSGAPKTVENAWGTLATMLNAAANSRRPETERFTTPSPHRGVKLPEHEHYEQAEHRYLDASELKQVIADTPARYRPLVWMLVGTGMRWGEATALLVSDVDLSARTVRVTKAWKHDRTNSRWYVGTPKTRKSRRTITLPNEVVEAVRPLVEGRKRTDLLFTNRDGNHVKHQPFYREIWRKRCIANIAEPKPRIHDLRHSHVAILIAAGVPLPVIQARLGHEKITTTIDTYGHLMPDLQVAAADAASRVFAPRVPELDGPTPPDGS